MTESSRSVCGRFNVPPPNEAQKIVCRACWTELPYDNDLCFACGHPVADAFGGSTEVVTPASRARWCSDFAHSPKTQVTPVAQIHWEGTGTLVAPLTDPVWQRRQRDSNFESEPRTLVAPKPEVLGFAERTIVTPIEPRMPNFSPGFDEQPATMVFAVPEHVDATPTPMDWAGDATPAPQAQHELAATLQSPIAQRYDARTGTTETDLAPLRLDLDESDPIELDEGDLELLGADPVTLVSPIGPAPVPPRAPAEPPPRPSSTIRAPVLGADGHE